MSTIEKTYSNTEKLIANALTLIKQLHEQIIQETDALLMQSAAETISEIAANKQRLTGQLEQFNNQLSQVLTTENLPSTDDGVQAYFQKAQAAGLSTENASEDWSQIKLLSTQCRSINEQNGMSINLLALHTQRSLQILKGQPQSYSTYGRDGSSQRVALMNNSLSA